ncbi:ATP-binding cassette domain-containing protein [Thiohalocapsa marina]|uniref:ATP-binding cassette domain-containing protein n=1 Tax=Thiohalocapsa marina TaxID=424902 RepID=UPI0036DEDF51
MISLRNLRLARGAKVLIEAATLQIHPGWKVGLTGANGSGKSSLFAMLRDQLHPDQGDLDMPPGWVIAHVAQETPGLSQPAIDYVLDGDAELRRIEAELAAAEAAHDGSHIGELHARLHEIGGYAARARAAALLDGLGFLPADIERPVSDFSGGWRMRLNLAQALMCRSDLLLLDEPTNHLDLDAVIWLEAWLRDYRGTLLLISHDREFLDACVTHIAHIEQQKLALYTGGYSDFERQRGERLLQQQAMFEKQQRDIAHMEDYIRRFRAKATKARQAQSRIKALERMERIAAAHVDTPFSFAFRDAPPAPDPLLQIEDGAVGYGDKTVLERITLTLRPGERVGLLGRNGAGKSTLIKLLAGRLAPLSGRCEPAQGLRIGYFAQHQMDQLRPHDSPLTHLMRLDPARPEQALRDFLGGFDFGGDRAVEPVAPFSGGEKARLALALIIYQRPNLLLLDEPTNHLDLEMRHALSEALQAFEGAMVLVSHDRHLLRITCDTLLLVHAGGVTPFAGSLDEYPAWLASQAGAPTDDTAKGPADRAAPAAGSRKDQRRREAEMRARLQPLRRRLRDVEARVEALTESQQALEQALADPSVYAEAAKARLLALLADKQRVDAELAQAEAQWLDDGEALERLQAALQGDACACD